MDKMKPQLKRSEKVAWWILSVFTAFSMSGIVSILLDYWFMTNIKVVDGFAVTPFGITIESYLKNGYVINVLFAALFLAVSAIFQRRVHWVAYGLWITLCMMCVLWWGSVTQKVTHLEFPARLRVENPFYSVTVPL